MLAAPSLWILPQGPVAVLLDEAKVHRALQHPYLSALLTRQLPDPGHALRDGLLQLMPWMAAQKTAWAELAQAVDHPAIHRAAELARGDWDLEALSVLDQRDLTVQPSSILGLYTASLRAMGVEGDWQDRSKFSPRCWQHLRRFQRMSEHGDPLHAAGGMVLGTELVFAEIAGPLVAAMSAAGGDPGALAPLRARILLSQNHEPELLAALEVMAAQPRGLSRLAGGRTLALDHLAHLFDGLMERAWRGDGA